MPLCGDEPSRPRPGHCATSGRPCSFRPGVIRYPPAAVGSESNDEQKPRAKQAPGLLFAAAASRLVLGAFAIVLLPFLYPGLAQHRLVFALYLMAAIVMQLLIWK